MPSAAYEEWDTGRRRTLDLVEAACREAERATARQLNQAFAGLLSAQFQGYCRELHEECVPLMLVGIDLSPRREALRGLLTGSRKLNRGNPNPGNLGSDFGLFGIDFWPFVLELDVRNEGRRERLEELNRWRNAIAHQDFTALPGVGSLRLRRVRDWRSACEGLAASFDEAMRRYFLGLIGRAW